MHFDVKEVCGRDLAPVDVLFFGSPCQDLSVAGKRAGLDGERSGLFFEAMRIVDEMVAPPPVCIWENVSGALSSNGGRDFGTVLREMARRWSGVAYRVLDLQFFGAAQRRRRVFVVGHFRGWERAAAILFEPEGLRWHPPARGAARQGVASPVTAGARKCDRGDWNDNLVAGPLGGRGDRGGWNDDSERSGAFVPVAFGGNNTSGPIDVAARLGCNETGSGYRLDFESDTLVTGTLCPGTKAAGSATQQDAEQGLLVAHALRGEGFDASEDGTGRGTPLVPVSFRAQGQDGFALREVTPPVCASNGGASGPPSVLAFPANLSGTQYASRPDLSPALGAANPVAVSLRGRDGGGTAELSGDRCPSMRARKGGGDKPHVLASRAVRRLMPVECERLMGLEDGFTAWGIDDDGSRVGLADGPRYKIIGNGVGKPHTRWIGTRAAADLRECGRGVGMEVAS